MAIEVKYREEARPIEEVWVIGTHGNPIVVRPTREGVYLRYADHHLGGDIFVYGEELPGLIRALEIVRDGHE